jgi:hypothetical protein
MSGIFIKHGIFDKLVCKSYFYKVHKNHIGGVTVSVLAFCAVSTPLLIQLYLTRFVVFKQ